MRLLRRRRLPGEFVRACSVFVHGQGAGPTLVAGVFNHEGLFTEQPGQVTSVPHGDVIALGRGIQDAIGSCVFRPEFDYRTLKPTDWPAFQASGLRTVKAFKREYDQLQVRGANAKNIIYAVEGAAKGQFDLHVAGSVSASASDEEVGAAVLAVWSQQRQLEHRIGVPAAEPGVAADAGPR